MDKTMDYLLEQIDEEIDDAESYAHNAMRFGVESPEMSKVLLALSAQELDHAKVLQGLAARHMAHDDTHESHKYVYSYMKERHEKRIRAVRMLHEVAGK